jgi:hypothetical protein
MASESKEYTPPFWLRVLYVLLGLDKGSVLWTALFVLAVPALVVWTVVLPRIRFGDEEERLFRAARHGDAAAIERSLAAGGKVNATSPVDGKSALFRAAIFGHTAAVRTLLSHGADSSLRAADDKTPLDITLAARADEKDQAIVRELDTIAGLLRAAQETPR